VDTIVIFRWWSNCDKRISSYQAS